MFNFRPAPLGGVVVLTLLLTGRAAFAQPVAVPGDPLSGSSMPNVAIGDEASGIVLPGSTGTAAADTAAGDTSMHVLAGLDDKTTDADFPAMLEPMLALYSQLLAINGQQVSPISLQRLQARLGGGAETSLLALDEVLAVNLSRVELLALPRARMSEMGLDAAMVTRLPALPSLIDDLRSAMMDMPAGLAEISGPVALAVWGREDGHPIVAILLLAAS